MRHSLSHLNLELYNSAPFYKSSITNNINSSATIYLKDPLNLSPYLTHTDYTFFLQINKEMMKSVGVRNNSILLVDPNITPVNGKMIIANYKREIMVRRFYRDRETIHLLSENKPSIIISDDKEKTISILGVVTSIIHQL